MILTNKTYNDFIKWIKINNINNDFSKKSESEKLSLICDFLFFEKNIVVDAMPILSKTNEEIINIDEIDNQIYDKIIWLGNGWIMPMKNDNYEFVKEDMKNDFNTKNEALIFIINLINDYLNNLSE